MGNKTFWGWYISDKYYEFKIGAAIHTVLLFGYCCLLQDPNPNDWGFWAGLTILVVAPLVYWIGTVSTYKQLPPEQ